VYAVIIEGIYSLGGGNSTPVYRATPEIEARVDVTAKTIQVAYPAIPLIARPVRGGVIPS
jgi:hypothetical protein